VLVATLSEPPERALQEGRLCAALAWYLVPHSLRLPALRERAEDLRGLVLAQLLASGVRRGEQPLGIEPAALAQLVAHDWPGNDAELALVVQRAARAAAAERVSLSDLLAAGFVAGAGRAAVGQTLPPAAEPARESERAPALARRGAAQRGVGRRSARRSEPAAASDVTSQAALESRPAAAAAEPGGSERPVPKRSERVRKARSRTAAASAPSAVTSDASADEVRASSEVAAAEAPTVDASSSEAALSMPAPGLAANEGTELAAEASALLTTPPESAAVLRDLEPLAAAEGGARPAARRRRRR
jgi:DNA-binding NtrC family response regulator